MVLSLEIIILNLVLLVVTALTATDRTENLVPSPQAVQDITIPHPINLGNLSQNEEIFTQRNTLANRIATKNTTSTSETEMTTMASTTTEYDESEIEDENIAVFNTPYIDDVDDVAKATPTEVIDKKTTPAKTTTTPTKLIDKNITLFNKIIYTEQKPATKDNQTASKKATMSNDWIWIILLVASLLCLCVIFAKMAYTRYHSNTYYTYEPVSGRALLAFSTSMQTRHRD